VEKKHVKDTLQRSEPNKLNLFAGFKDGFVFVKKIKSGLLYFF